MAFDAARPRRKARTMTQKHQGPTFQALVLKLKGDRSYETVAKAAGGFPNAKSLQRIVKDGFTRMPTPETFSGLSRALNVSQRDLVLAAARTLGIDIEDENPNDLQLIGAKRLPQESQELLIGMSREMQAWMDGVRDAGPGPVAEVAESAADHSLDNVHQLPVPAWGSMAADSGDSDIDPDQLPDD